MRVFGMPERSLVRQDEFVSSVTREKAAEELLLRADIERRKVRGCLDPLTKELISFENDEDLQVRGVRARVPSDTAQSPRPGRRGARGGRRARACPSCCCESSGPFAFYDKLVVCPTNQMKIDAIYSKLDEDNSEGLDFAEFQQGIRDMKTKIHITRDVC